MANTTLTTGLWFDRGDLSAELLLAFEAYGHAMACAASLKLQIALALVRSKANKHRTTAVGPFPSEELHRHGNRLRRLSLSKLIPIARKEFKLSDRLVEALELAKRARDSLAHNFWDSNLGLIHSEKGISLIVESCTLEVWHFKNVSLDFEREIGFSVFDYFEMTKSSNTQAEMGLDAVLREYR